MTYIGVVYFIERTVFANHLSPDWTPRLLALPPTLIIAPSFKSRLQPWIEERLFAGWESSRQAMRDLGLRLCTSLNVETIAQTAVDQVTRTFDLKGSALFLLETTASRYTRVAVAGSLPLPATLAQRELKPEIFTGICADIVLTRELEWRRKTTDHLDAPNVFLEAWLQEHEISVLVPVRFQTSLLGLWLLGVPAAQRPLTRGHGVLLRQVADQLGLALHNALAVRQLEAQQKLLAKGRELAVFGTLATEMAHELTKPLTHIMNEGSRLSRGAKETAKEGLSRIEKEAQRAVEILDGFALLSPDRSLQQISVPVTDLLEESLGILGIAEDPTIRIIRDYGNHPSIYVNPGQIVQVFTNVIQNAWQAMSRGGTLTLVVKKSTSGEPPCLDVLVEDTGPGVPHDLLSKVFEPFFTTKGHQGGRGVGLTISRAMMERHSGGLEMESPIISEGGTRVRISLPITKKENSYGT
jgi:signal transduction histidine kinase